MTAQQDIKTHGMTVPGSHGPIRNPAVAVVGAATSALCSLAAEFGLTPSSRARLALPDDAGETLEDLLAMPGEEDAA